MADWLFLAVFKFKIHKLNQIFTKHNGGTTLAIVNSEGAIKFL